MCAPELMNRLSLLFDAGAPILAFATFQVAEACN